MIPKALRDVKIFFFWLRVYLIAFIISIEKEASLLALAKSIYQVDRQSGSVVYKKMLCNIQWATFLNFI